MLAVSQSAPDRLSGLTESAVFCGQDPCALDRAESGEYASQTIDRDGRRDGADPKRPGGDCVLLGPTPRLVRQRPRIGLGVTLTGYTGRARVAERVLLSGSGGLGGGHRVDLAKADSNRSIGKRGNEVVHSQLDILLGPNGIVAVNEVDKRAGLGKARESISYTCPFH